MPVPRRVGDQADRSSTCRDEFQVSRASCGSSRYGRFSTDLRTTATSTASMSQKGVFNPSTFKKSFGSNSFRSSTGNGKNSTPPPGMPPMAQVIMGTTTYTAGGTRSTTGRGGSANRGPTTTMTLPASRAGAGFVAGLREGASVSEEKKRMKRQAEDDKRARRELHDLVGRDRGKTPGGEYLERARREREKRDPGSSKRRKHAEDASGDGDTGSSSSGEPGEAGSKDEKDGKEVKPAIQSVFKAEALRRIGFNPTAKPGELARDESAEAKAYRVSSCSPPFLLSSCSTDAVFVSVLARSRRWHGEPPDGLVRSAGTESPFWGQGASLGTRIVGGRPQSTSMRRRRR